VKLDVGWRAFKECEGRPRGVTRRHWRTSHPRYRKDRADIDPIRGQTRRRSSRHRRQLSATSWALRGTDPTWAVVAGVLGRFSAAANLGSFAALHTATRPLALGEQKKTETVWDQENKEYDPRGG